MLKLRDGIVELYRKVATSLPKDVEEGLKLALEKEKEPAAIENIKIILENIKMARKNEIPLCQDTGVPVFYVKVPRCLGQERIKETIIEATRIATEKIPLRPNSVDVLTEKNTGDNTGRDFPVIHMEETEEEHLIIDLLLKGGGSENIGCFYKLPCEPVKAERNLEGVKKTVIDAVLSAQGKGCPPYIVGIAIGGSRDHVAYLSKKQLMRKLNEENPEPLLKDLEQSLFKDINKLGIGVMGLGGASTCIGVKIAISNRHPASYFVDITFSCWALRRGRLIW
ncbi:MAG: fumarate hydratase [Thermodesulfovibrionales bacterium]|nr:fumarate hydratase [Thermodesulfovibrionales bacterium]